MHKLANAGRHSRTTWPTIVRSINEDVQSIERMHNSHYASRPQAFAATASAAMTFKNFARSLHKRAPLTRQMCADFPTPDTPKRFPNVRNLYDALQRKISSDFFPENV